MANSANPSPFTNPLTRPPTDAEKRITVNFSGELYDTLMEMARRSGKNVSDTIRGAITLQKYLDDARRDGNRILLERDGKVRELVTL
jgi:metal-responsive CopG/Arc/MetJ family transcriptional regulator